MVENYNIDVLPMAAIGLILVILMILIAPMVTTHANTPVDVPSAHTEERDVEEDIAVTYTADGHLFLNDHELSPQVLVESLKAHLAKDPFKLTVIRADREALHADVLEILAACRRAGALRMACATTVDTTASVYK